MFRQIRGLNFLYSDTMRRRAPGQQGTQEVNGFSSWHPECASYGDSRSDGVEGLETRSGYCDCPDLQELYEKRRGAISKERICDELEAKVNAEVDMENPSEKDRPLLETYKGAIQEFESAVEDYHVGLSHYVNSRKIDLVFYDKSKDEPSRKIDPKDIDEYLNASDVPITLNCHSCNQQIDEFAELVLSEHP